MEFSGAVKLTDLSDFLAPSQACVKSMMQPKLIKTTDRATLSDCLACSGCVTSAETVLLQEQPLSKDALSHKRVVVSLSEQSLASLSHRFGFCVKDTYGKIANVLKSLGVADVKDMQYAKELALRTSAEDLITRFREGNTLICSECPGWICYAEKKADPTIIPMLSTAKSPMLVQDLLVKIEDPACAHVCVLPCFDKKLEGVRVEDGPLVLTTRELEEWLRPKDFQQAKSDPVPDVLSEGRVFHYSHGYAELIFVQAAEILYQKRIYPAYLVLKQGPKRDWAVILDRNWNSRKKMGLFYCGS